MKNMNINKRNLKSYVTYFVSLIFKYHIIFCRPTLHAILGIDLLGFIDIFKTFMRS